MLEIIKESATRMVQGVLKEEMVDDVGYMLDNSMDSYDKTEMNGLIEKLLSSLEETIATFGG